MRNSLLTAVVLLSLVLLCCGGGKSDTGYTGTWIRGNERQWSTLFIEKEGDEYRFRIKVLADDGGRLVQCDDQGRCEELIRGQKSLDYRFTTRIDPGTGRLLVEYEVTPTREGAESYHYVDELTVEEGGLKLRVETSERFGEALPEGRRPTRFFDKVSNRVYRTVERGFSP